MSCWSFIGHSMLSQITFEFHGFHLVFYVIFTGEQNLNLWVVMTSCFTKHCSASILNHFKKKESFTMGENINIVSIGYLYFPAFKSTCDSTKLNHCSNNITFLMFKSWLLFIVTKIHCLLTLPLVIFVFLLF